MAQWLIGAPLCQPTVCRLVFVARGGAWSPVTHHHWPDGFKDAARTLLLVGGGAGSGAASPCACPAPAGLAALPPGVLLRILQLAAAPMSAWL